MSEGNGEGSEFVSREEFESALEDMVANIVDVINVCNMQTRAINTQAEVAGLHRFILEKFVPTPHLEAAAKEYKEARLQVIEEETKKSLVHAAPLSNEIH